MRLSPTNILKHNSDTAQEMKISIKDFFSKCDQIRRTLPIWSHLLIKSMMENSFFEQCRSVESFIVPLMSSIH